MIVARPPDGHGDAFAVGFGDGLGAPADEVRRLAATATGQVTDCGGQRPAGCS